MGHSAEREAHGTAALCTNGITASGWHCTGSAHVGSTLIRCTDPSHNVATFVATEPLPTFAELLTDPTQQLDTEGVVLASVLDEQERDRLRAEGWRACVAHIRRAFNGWLSPEDVYWVGRQNAFRTRLTPPAEPGADRGSES